MRCLPERTSLPFGRRLRHQPRQLYQQGVYCFRMNAQHRALLSAGLAVSILAAVAFALTQRTYEQRGARSPLESPLRVPNAEAAGIAAQYTIKAGAAGDGPQSDLWIGALNASIENDARTGSLWLADGQVYIGVVKTDAAASFDARVRALREFVLQGGKPNRPVVFVPVDYAYVDLRRIQDTLCGPSNPNTMMSCAVDVIKNRVVLSAGKLLNEHDLLAQIGMTGAIPSPFILHGNMPATPIWAPAPDPNGLITKIERVNGRDILTLSYQGRLIELARMPQPETVAERAMPMAAAGGVLGIADGCLAGGTGEGALQIIWPENVQPIVEDATGKLALINEKGTIVARLGEAFYGSGGYFTLPDEPGSPARPACLGKGREILAMNPMYHPAGTTWRDIPVATASVWVTPGPREERVISGTVVSNDRGEKTDGRGLLTIMMDHWQREVAVIYSYGGAKPCDNKAASDVASTLKPGTRVEMRIRGNDNNELSVCELPELFVRVLGP